MQIELPANVVSAFGVGEQAFSACCWMVACEDEIFERYGCHPVELSGEQVREFFGVVVFYFVL